MCRRYLCTELYRNNDKICLLFATSPLSGAGEDTSTGASPTAPAPQTPGAQQLISAQHLSRCFTLITCVQSADLGSNEPSGMASVVNTNLWLLQNRRNWKDRAKLCSQIGISSCHGWGAAAVRFGRAKGPVWGCSLPSLEQFLAEGKQLHHRLHCTAQQSHACLAPSAPPGWIYDLM